MFLPFRLPVRTGSEVFSYNKTGVGQKGGLGNKVKSKSGFKILSDRKKENTYKINRSKCIKILSIQKASLQLEPVGNSCI